MFTKFTPRLVSTIFVTLLTLTSLPAHGVWNESIQIVGDTPVPAGATVSLTLPSGQVIDGEVRNENDQQILIFVLPGDGPSPGTVAIATTTGDRLYSLPGRTDDSGLTLALKDNAVRIKGFQPTRKSTVSDDYWSFSLGAGAAYYTSDYFNAVINDNEQELTTILNGFGGTSIATSSRADDSASGYSLALAVRRNLDTLSSVYLELGYGKTDELKGRITGTADVFGNAFETRADGESELEIVSAALGYERQVGKFRNFRWYAGLGAMWTDLKDQSRTLTSVNGMEVDIFESSTRDHDNAEFVEIGVRYFVPVGEYQFEFDAGVLQSNEIFNGESLTRFEVGVAATF